MMKSIKRMVLTGAAVAVMMSFAAPALAEEEQLKPLPSNTDDLPVLTPDDPDVCDRIPKLCSDDLPILEPDSPDKADPVVDPGKDNSDNEESDTSGSGGSSGGGSSGGIGSGSETIDRGGTFVSSFLPANLTSTIGEAGNSVKENLPAPVAKSLPNTGGGWSFLILLVAAGLIAGAFLIRSIVRRTTSVTRTAQQ